MPFRPFTEFPANFIPTRKTADFKPEYQPFGTLPLGISYSKFTVATNTRWTTFSANFIKFHRLVNLLLN